MIPVRNLDSRALLLVAVTLAALIGVTLLDPIPQDQGLHQLADQRPLFGVPNAADVLSNLPFLMAGLFGLHQLRSNWRHLAPQHRPALGVLFSGIAITSIGSTLYHLNPNDQTLLWDRLPMTIAFMALTSLMIGIYISPRGGAHSLVPLLLLGIAAPIYWHISLSYGTGDLRPYVLVQFLPLVLTLLILLLYHRATLPSQLFWLAFSCYLFAKAAELHDLEVLRISGVISGHTLKHLLAGGAAASLALLPHYLGRLAKP